MVSLRKAPTNVQPRSGIASQPLAVHFWAFCLCVRATKTPLKSLMLQKANSKVAFCCWAGDEPGKNKGMAAQATAAANFRFFMEWVPDMVLPGDSSIQPQSNARSGRLNLPQPEIHRHLP